MAIVKITGAPTSNEQTEKINEIIDKKQDKLVSGTNIKTVNNTSILGSGNITITSAPDIDNKSITTNTSDELQTVGIIDQNNTTNAIKTWTGTKAEYDAIVTKDTNTLYWVTDAKIIYLGETPVGNFSGGRNVGEIITSSLPLTDAGLHLLDGSLILGDGIYNAFVDYIAELYNADPTANYFAQSHGEVAWVQPTATGSTTAITGGNMVITSSSSYSNYDAWKAMDGVHSGTTATTGWGTNNTSANQWWQLKLPYQIRITGLKGYQRYDTTPANANTIGRFYTSSDMTTPIGDTYTNASSINWNAVEVSGIPEEGIVTDTIYFQKTGGGNYGGLGELVITATVVGSGKTAEQVWQQSITDYGVCGKFVYDSTNNTVRLPKVTGKIDGTTDINALGDLEPLFVKLPNITGGVNGLVEWNSKTDSGAIKTTKNANPGSFSGGSGSTMGFYSATFNASLSSSVYSGNGSNTTIHEQAVKVFCYIVIANSTKTEIQSDIDEIATDLNGKADRDGSNMVSSVKNFDGGWVNFNSLVTLSTATAVGTYTLDLSSYLPDDNYNYEVKILFYCYKSGDSEYHYGFYNDIFPKVGNGDSSWGYLNINVRSNTMCFDMPVSTQRYIIYKITQNAAEDVYVRAVGYRRMGTNQ